MKTCRAPYIFVEKVKNKMKIMFYTMNKLRRSAYLYTPSGKRNQVYNLIPLSLSILHLFSNPRSGTINFCSSVFSLAKTDSIMYNK